ncbi:hypothetical protein H5410_040345 [Solanum commersonii]|uniref:Avr9/Cf-9 rapidly elicited protein 180 n=1 Tax=Solanum commersonii TaxID=4109 RepID=A0A9J5XQN9_SOLCO|nr:hypothetical protein H5410_040345 [Solanum commersonii]
MKVNGYLLSFKRLNKNNNGNSIGASKSLSNASASQGEIIRRDENNCSTKTSSLRWRFKKSLYKLHHWFVDSFLFKIVSIFEAITLVSTLAFFFLCYGFHI